MVLPIFQARQQNRQALWDVNQQARERNRQQLEQNRAGRQAAFQANRENVAGTFGTDRVAALQENARRNRVTNQTIMGNNQQTVAGNVAARRARGFPEPEQPALPPPPATNTQTTEPPSSNPAGPALPPPNYNRGSDEIVLNTPPPPPRTQPNVQTPDYNAPTLTYTDQPGFSGPWEDPVLNRPAPYNPTQTLIQPNNYPNWQGDGMGNPYYVNGGNYMYGTQQVPGGYPYSSGSNNSYSPNGTSGSNNPYSPNGMFTAGNGQNMGMTGQYPFGGVQNQAQYNSNQLGNYYPNFQPVGSNVNPNMRQYQGWGGLGPIPGGQYSNGNPSQFYNPPMGPNQTPSGPLPGFPDINTGNYWNGVYRVQPPTSPGTLEYDSSATYNNLPQGGEYVDILRNLATGGGFGPEAEQAYAQSLEDEIRRGYGQEREDLIKDLNRVGASQGAFHSGALKAIAGEELRKLGEAEQLDVTRAREGLAYTGIQREMERNRMQGELATNWGTLTQAERDRNMNYVLGDKRIELDNLLGSRNLDIDTFSAMIAQNMGVSREQLRATGMDVNIAAIYLDYALGRAASDAQFAQINAGIQEFLGSMDMQQKQHFMNMVYGFNPFNWGGF